MIQSSHKIRSDDGVYVAFDLYRATETASETVLIICHGFFQSKQTATFQRMSRELAANIDVLCMDFRGHGKSSGLFTFSARENSELEAVLAWVRPNYLRIIVMGFSLGAAVAINTVSKHRNNVCGLIAVSAPATFEDIEFKFWMPEAIRTGLAGLGRGAGCRPGSLFLKKQRAIEHIQLLSGIPVFFVHGTKDAIVSVEHSRRLFAAAHAPKRLEIIEGGSHAEALFRDNPQAFTALVNDWLARLPSTNK